MASPKAKFPVTDLQAIFQPLFAYAAGNESMLEPSQDAIFVSIDLANVGRNGRPLDIGVSVLDGRCLVSFLRGKEKHDHPIISTHHYCFSARSLRRASKGFRFGEVQNRTTWNRAELHQILRSIFRYHTGAPTENKCCNSDCHWPIPIAALSNSQNNTHFSGDDTLHAYRPIILVGHDVGNDLRSLRKLDFDPRDVAPVVAVLDPQAIAYALHRRNFTLGGLCSYLAIVRVKNFHVSGNDAAYTLLALLKLANRVSGPSCTEGIQNIISAVLKRRRTTVKIKPSNIPLDWAENLSGPSVENL